MNRLALNGALNGARNRLALIVCFLLIACGSPAIPLPQGTWTDPVVRETCSGSECAIFIDVGPVRTFSLDLRADDEPITAGRNLTTTAQQARISVTSDDGELTYRDTYEQGQVVTLPHGDYLLVVRPSVLSLAPAWPSQFSVELSVDETTPDVVTVDVFASSSLVSRPAELTVIDGLGPDLDLSAPSGVELDSPCSPSRDADESGPLLRVPRARCGIVVEHQAQTSGTHPIRTDLRARHDPRDLDAPVLDELLDLTIVTGRIDITGAPEGEPSLDDFELTGSEYELDDRTLSLSVVGGAQAGRVFLPADLPPTLLLTAHYDTCTLRAEVPTGRWTTEQVVAVNVSDVPCLQRIETLTADLTATLPSGTHACDLRPELLGVGTGTDMERVGDVCRLTSQNVRGVLAGDTRRIDLSWRLPGETESRVLRGRTLTIDSSELGDYSLSASLVRFDLQLSLDDGEVLRNLPRDAPIPEGASVPSLRVWAQDEDGERFEYAVQPDDVRAVPQPGPPGGLAFWELTSYAPIVAVRADVYGVSVYSEDITPIDEEVDVFEIDLRADVAEWNVQLLSDGQAIEDVVDTGARRPCALLTTTRDDAIVQRALTCPEGRSILYATPGIWDLHVIWNITWANPFSEGSARRTLEL